MLILVRKPNQSVMIGDNIVVTVLRIKGQQITLGIQAPREIAVNREEIDARIKAGVPKS
jgi:carbon storage regulator